MIPPIGKRGNPGNEHFSVWNCSLWLRKGNLATKGYQNFMPMLPGTPLARTVFGPYRLQLDFSR